MAGRTIRIGVVGVGWWAAANHLPILKSRGDVELVGVCRLGVDELRKVQDQFGIRYGTESFDELLDQVPMDALIVASPHRLHGKQTLAALERGLHVLVEKPMTVDAAEARAIVALAAGNQRHVVVPYGWNFKPYFAEARRLIADGQIGTIRHVSAVMASPIGELMSGRAMPGTENELFRPNPETWANPQNGGYGWGQLVHLLGGLFYLADLAPEKVFAFTGKSTLGADLFNSVALQFAGGATAALSGAATVPDGRPFQVDIRLYGTEGMLLLDVERERCVVQRLDGTEIVVPIAPGDGAYVCIEPVNRFVELCKGAKVENAGTALVGARAVEVVEAMLRSARSGAAETI
ncbi:MAG: Gfo/Idh/MocA family oxidoreductase [Devosia sp.]